MTTYSTYIERDTTFGLQSNYNGKNKIENTYFVTDDVNIDVEKIVQVVESIERVNQIVLPDGYIYGNLIGNVADKDKNIILNTVDRSFNGDIISIDGSLVLDNNGRSFHGDIYASDGLILVNHQTKVFYGTVYGNIIPPNQETPIINVEEGTINGNIITSDGTVVVDNENKTVTASILAPDSTVLLDIVNGTFTGDVIGNVVGDVISSNDSSVIIDTSNNTITTTAVTSETVSADTVQVASITDVSGNEIINTETGAINATTIQSDTIQGNILSLNGTDILVDVSSNIIRGDIFVSLTGTDPVNANELTTKNYVDSLFSSIIIDGSGSSIDLPHSQSLAGIGNSISNAFTKIFVNIMGSISYVEANLLAGTVDGEEKKIILVGISDSATELHILTTGLYVDSNGEFATLLKMDKIGQSIHMIWHSTTNKWYSVAGGATII